MIKKLNDEVDHLPLFVKIIACIIMTIFITLMSFLFVGVVNAQTQVPADYWAWKDSNNNWTTLNNGNTESGANTNQINIGWNNQTGNINGVIYFEAIGTLDNTAKINVELWTEPTQTSSGVITKSCTVENYNIIYKKTRCQINFTIANNNQPYIRTAIKFDTNHLFDSITVSGYANVEPNNGATTEDITNQTIQIINNAIQNALNQSETIVNESNSLGNRIETIINSATNAIQNSLMHCTEYHHTYTSADTNNPNGILGTNGQTISNNEYRTTDYIKVNANQVYKIVTNYTAMYPNICTYSSSKTKLTCTEYNNNTNIEIIPTEEGYIRFSYKVLSNSMTTLYTGKYCQSNTDAIIENQNQNTDRMIDKMILFHEADEEEWEEEKGLLQSILSAIGGIFSSSIDDPSNTLNSFNNSIATNNTVSSLLLLPVRLYQNVLNNINGSCNSFTLGSLYNHNLTMTCIQPQSFLGSALYGVIDVIISGFFILHIRKKFVDIFNHLTSLRTGGNELE